VVGKWVRLPQTKTVSPRRPVVKNESKCRQQYPVLTFS
jgi:hypothetical protein